MNAPFLPDRLPAHRRFSVQRIAAVMLRHFYLLRSSISRLAELIYWPLVQMLMWAFPADLSQRTRRLRRACWRDAARLDPTARSWSAASSAVGSSRAASRQHARRSRLVR